MPVPRRPTLWVASARFTNEALAAYVDPDDATDSVVARALLDPGSLV